MNAQMKNAAVKPLKSDRVQQYTTT